MAKNSKYTKSKFKTVKIDLKTHRKLRIYSARHDSTLWETIRKITNQVIRK